MSSNFGPWLRSQLERRDWNQADLASRVGASTGAVSMWMRGERIPSPASVEKIADVLGVDVDGVLAIAGHRPTVAPLDPASPVARLYVYLRRRGLTEEELAAVTGLLETFDKARGRVRT